MKQNFAWEDYIGVRKAWNFLGVREGNEELTLIYSLLDIYHNASNKCSMVNNNPSLTCMYQVIYFRDLTAPMMIQAPLE